MDSEGRTGEGSGKVVPNGEDIGRLGDLHACIDLKPVSIVFDQAVQRTLHYERNSMRVAF